MKQSIEEKLLNPKPGSKAAAAKEFGIDLTLLVENLRQTPQKRIEKLQMFEQKMDKSLKLLTDNYVKFIVVGEIATFIHGWKTIAQKFEICYSRTDENLENLANVLSEVSPRFRGFHENLPFIFDIFTLRNGTNFTLNTNIGDIDLLGEVAGVGTYKDVFESSESKKLFGFEVRVLTIDGLIKAKTAAGRMKDLLILPELEALREALADEK
jgi:predicted nucleotidyltransferase